LKTRRKTSHEAHRKVTNKYKILKLYQSKQQLSNPKKKKSHEKNEKNILTNNKHFKNLFNQPIFFKTSTTSRQNMLSKTDLKIIIK